MKKEQTYVEELFPSNNFDYIETRFNDLRVRVVCNECGYRFFSKRNYSFVDNLEGYDELIDGIRCPNCGSKNVDEI